MEEVYMYILRVFTGIITLLGILYWSFKTFVKYSFSKVRNELKEYTDAKFEKVQERIENIEGDIYDSMIKDSLHDKEIKEITELQHKQKHKS